MMITAAAVPPPPPFLVDGEVDGKSAELFVVVLLVLLVLLVMLVGVVALPSPMLPPPTPCVEVGVAVEVVVEVVGQAPSPGRQSVALIHALPFFTAGVRRE
jgi:hypothetical protein